MTHKPDSLHEHESQVRSTFDGVLPKLLLASGHRATGGIPVSEHLFAWRTTTTARLTDDAEAMGNDLDPVLCTVGPATAHRRPYAVQLLGRLFLTDLPSPAGPTFRLSATELLPFQERVQGDGNGDAASIDGGEAEGNIVNCESVPGKTGSLSVSSYSSHSMMAIHYVPMRPRPRGPARTSVRDQSAGTNHTPSSIRASIFPSPTAFVKLS